MNTQSYHDIINDESYNEGYDAAEKRLRKKMMSAREKVGNVIQILLSAGTSEDDDTIIELTKAFNELR